LVWVKRGAWLLLALAVIVGVYKGRSLVAAATRKPAAPTFATVRVGTGPVTSTVSDPGTIQAATATNVVAAVAGHVDAVKVKVGQVVKQGDALIQLSDDSGLGAEVAAAEASLTQAEAQLQADENPAINVTQAQIQAAQIQIQQQQLAVQQQEDTVAKLTVRAPFAGLVAAVNVSPGQSVGAGQALLTYVDNSQTWAVVQVQETMLSEVAVGGPATVTIQGTGATLSGHIIQIGTTPTAGAKGGQSFPVTILLDHPGTAAMANMTAIATITPTGPNSVGALPFTATGTVTYPQTVTISAQEPGTLTSIASLGQTVQAGGVLAVLSNPDLQAQLQQAQLTLQADEDNLANLQNPAPASATTIEAQQAQVNSLQQQLALRQQAYANLTITAPISGEITAINVLPGDAVSQGTTVITMLDPNSLEAQVAVDELDISKVKVGQDAQITVNALPGKTYAGKVVFIAPTAVVSNGVSTYQVDISLPNRPELLTGMSVQAAIEVANVADATRVPAEAVQNVNGRYFVMVPTAAGGERPQPVQVGVVGDVWTQIVSGLQPGDTIVVASTAGAGTPKFPGGAFFFESGGRVPGGGGNNRGGGGAGGR
jgi:HlyD family secretion protein